MNIADKTLPLPKELHQGSSLKGTIGCLYAMAAWLVPSFIIGYVWSGALSLPLASTILITLAMGVVGGYGILLTGFMGHDGTHFSLHPNKVVSSVLGIIVTASVPFYLLMGFTISHWNHHKFTNTVKDPDSELFGKFNSWWSRAILARPYSFIVFAETTFRLAFDIPLSQPYTFPLEKKTIRNLARFNIITNVVTFTLLFYVLYAFPVYGCGVLVVYAFGSVISGLNPYVEHDGTGLGRGHDTRTSVGPWLDFFLMGNNYHLEHHLYPTIPFYNLKKAYRHLAKEGYYGIDRHQTRGAWSTYLYTSGKYPYPQYPVEELRKPAPSDISTSRTDTPTPKHHGEQ